MADQMNTLVSERVAGATYQQLASKYGKSSSVCRSICKKAARDGLVTAEQIRRVPKAPRPALPDAEFNQRWLARVKSSIVVSETGCWLWQGEIKAPWGYGYTSYRGKGLAVHRSMYKVVHGVKLTRDQYVCHTCDVRHCCNPDHLWIGSNSDNQKDSSRKSRHYESRRLYCESDHEFTEENTFLRPSKSGGVVRICKQCQRDRARREWANGNAKARQQRYRAKLRAKRLAQNGDSHV